MDSDRAEGKEFVDLLDTLWYVFVNEADADIDTFCRIFKSKGVIFFWEFVCLVMFNHAFWRTKCQVLAKLFVLVDTNKTGQVSVDQVMAFFTECTLQRWVVAVVICTIYLCQYRAQRWDSYFNTDVNVYAGGFVAWKSCSQEEPKRYSVQSPRTTARNSTSKTLKNWFLLRT